MMNESKNGEIPFGARMSRDYMVHTKNDDMYQNGSPGSESQVPTQQDRNGSDRFVLLTGGAGFIGTNLAHRLMSSGKHVRIFDNLSRPGVEKNLNWLKEIHGSHLSIQLGDVREFQAVQKAVQGAERVYHFAAQVAVTSSIENPYDDFDVNLRGTFNVLEALRKLKTPPPLLYTSSNKVYGALPALALKASASRYIPEDRQTQSRGVDEGQQLDFHSPYGCSKGAADQYVLDYARIFGLSNVVFRMSCIYGPHQFGTEDQGWVAHFLIRAIQNEPITIFGDGKQVRDVLFVEDLVDAMLLALEQSDRTRGHAYNIGGGPANATSLIEILSSISALVPRKPDVRLESWRPGDQRYYVSDGGKFTAHTGWTPRTNIQEGLTRLYTWLKEAKESPVAEMMNGMESTTVSVVDRIRL